MPYLSKAGHSVETVDFQASSFPLSAVRLLDGPFNERQDVNAAYLLLVQPDRLLAGFRERAGLPAKATRYGGWEARDITGHSLGHYLSAVSLLFASTGMPAAKERVSYIVDELADCQTAIGNGYLLPLDQKAFNDLRSGQVKASGFSLNGAWVPFYTLHKVFAGLRDAYRLTENVKALDIARRCADWLADILSPLSDEQVQEMLRAEFGGMNEVLADLAVDTGDPRYLQMAERCFRHRAIVDPLIAGQDHLNGQHGNTQIPKIIGLAREYELTGDATLRTAVETFWTAVVHDRSFAMGGHGEGEHFSPPEQFPQQLTPHTAETCNSYNMLKLTGHLFAWQPKAEQMDFVERAIINHLLAHIGQRPGEFGYFLGLQSVAMKVFSTQFDSWWCCVGTGMENPARYGELIYFHTAETLWVNLFIASTLTWTNMGVTVRQETKFPDADAVRFTLSCDRPTKFALKLRHPYWCEVPAVAVNGQPVTVASSPSSYITIDRTWLDGDVITLHLPMSLRLEPLPHSDGKIVAPMFGPLVLAGVLPAVPGEIDEAKQRFGEHLLARGKTDEFPPVFVASNAAEVLGDLQPKSGAFAEFSSTSTVRPKPITFMPLHRVYEEHYAVYFPLMTSAEWADREEELRANKERLARWEAATLDHVTPGFQQPEVEHQFQSDNSRTGDFQHRKWRDARNGGWFSYEMKVDPISPAALIATYWGGEREAHTFDILIDGVVLTTQRLRLNKTGDFFDEIYPIPPTLTLEKAKVTIRFQSAANNAAGPLYALRMMRADAIGAE